MIISEEIKLTEQNERLGLYTFFARLFSAQTKAEDLPLYSDHLAELDQSYTPVVEEALKTINAWSERKDADHLIRTEYARLFIMPGGVQPVESVYRSEQPRLMGDPWLQVKEFYKRNGLVLEKPAAHPEDHASVELSFMAHLINGGFGLSEQKRFFSEHISQWFTLLLDKMANHQAAAFYRDLALCCATFIEMEKAGFAAIPDLLFDESEQRSEK
jgi:TorA maturation chaperone TorD